MYILKFILGHLLGVLGVLIRWVLIWPINGLALWCIKTADKLLHGFADDSND